MDFALPSGPPSGYSTPFASTPVTENPPAGNPSLIQQQQPSLSSLIQAELNDLKPAIPPLNFNPNFPLAPPSLTSPVEGFSPTRTSFNNGSLTNGSPVYNQPPSSAFSFFTASNPHLNETSMQLQKAILKIQTLVKEGKQLDEKASIDLRNEFIQSADAFEYAAFFAPTAPAPIQPSSLGGADVVKRKRAKTESRMAGPKHRRVSDPMAGLQGLPQGLVRPRLSALPQIHSSPMLPTEQHYRTGSHGSMPRPAHMSADAAAAGQHFDPHSPSTISSASPVAASPGSSALNLPSHMPAGVMEMTTQPISAVDSNPSPLFPQSLSTPIDPMFSTPQIKAQPPPMVRRLSRQGQLGPSPPSAHSSVYSQPQMPTHLSNSVSPLTTMQPALSSPASLPAPPPQPNHGPNLYLSSVRHRIVSGAASFDAPPQSLDSSWSRCMSATTLKPINFMPVEIYERLNMVFINWLPELCDNIELTDSKGEKVHQPLLQKRMAKLDGEHQWRPFKFRIQAFTNCFAEVAKFAGVSDHDSQAKYIRTFLWNQPLVSRYNDEGRRAKSKGNHVWSIDARRTNDSSWEFRVMPTKLLPVPPPLHPGRMYHYQPRIWDPQCQGRAEDTMFIPISQMPDYLSWNDGVLSGMVPHDPEPLSIDVQATYTRPSNDMVDLKTMECDDQTHDHSQAPAPVCATFNIYIVEEEHKDKHCRCEVDGSVVSSRANSPPPLMQSLQSAVTGMDYIDQNPPSANHISDRLVKALPRTPVEPPYHPSITPKPVVPPSLLSPGTTAYATTPTSLQPSPVIFDGGDTYSTLDGSMLPRLNDNLPRVQDLSIHSAYLQSPLHSPVAQPSTGMPPLSGFELGPTQLDSAVLAQAKAHAAQVADANIQQQAVNIKVSLETATQEHQHRIARITNQDPAAVVEHPAIVQAQVEAKIGRQLAATAVNPADPSSSELLTAVIGAKIETEANQQQELAHVIAVVQQHNQAQQQHAQLAQVHPSALPPPPTNHFAQYQ